MFPIFLCGRAALWSCCTVFFLGLSFIFNLGLPPLWCILCFLIFMLSCFLINFARAYPLVIMLGLSVESFLNYVSNWLGNGQDAPKQSLCVVASLTSWNNYYSFITLLFPKLDSNISSTIFFSFKELEDWTWAFPLCQAG